VPIPQCFRAVSVSNYPYSVSDHWSGSFDETALRTWVERMRGKLGERPVSLGLVFMGPRFFPHAEAVLALIKQHGEVPVLAGCSGRRLLCSDRDVEMDAGITLCLYSLPGVDLCSISFNQNAWRDEVFSEQLRTGDRPDRGKINGWLVFMEPFAIDTEQWLEAWRKSHGPVPVLGGLASGLLDDSKTQIYLNETVLEAGGVAIGVGGAIRLLDIVSQGCTPIGSTWTITGVEGNKILSIGNRPAYDVLKDVFANLSDEERRNANEILFAGLVVDEYLEDYQRGDFLIRDILGADPATGAIEIGAFPRVGQTLQFQRRDAETAIVDLKGILARARQEIGDRMVYGGVLCSCNGRAKALLGNRMEDAAIIREVLGPIGLTGVFCDGEIGPVGKRNYLHGYSASLALFVGRATAS